MTREIEKRDGIYYLKVPVAGTDRREWVSTGERDLARAKAVIREFGADRLIHLAHARALTQDTIAITTVGRRISWTDVVKLWLEWKEMRGSPRTTLVYLQFIRQLIFAFGVAHKPMNSITERQIFEYINDGKTTASTANVRLAALRSIYRFANARALVVGNPAELVEVDYRGMTMEQKEQKHRTPITEEEYQKILGACRRPERDWAILSYCCGLRHIDAVGLEYGSFGADHIVLYPSKTSRTNQRLSLPLADPLIARPELQELIATLLASRPTTGEAAEESYVWPKEFLRFQVSELRPEFSNYYIKLFRSLGMVGRSFHGFRVAFARRLQAAGRPIEAIATAMGHGSTDTTAIYLGELRHTRLRRMSADVRPVSTPAPSRPSAAGTDC